MLERNLVDPGTAAFVQMLCLFLYETDVNALRERLALLMVSWSRHLVYTADRSAATTYCFTNSRTTQHN